MLQQYEKSNRERGKQPRNSGLNSEVQRRESQNDEHEAVPQNECSLGQEDLARCSWEKGGPKNKQYDGNCGKPKDNKGRNAREWKSNQEKGNND